MTTGNCRLATGDCRVTAGNCRATIGNCRMTAGDCRMATGDCRVTTGDCRVTIGNCRMTFFEIFWGSWLIFCGFVKEKPTGNRFSCGCLPEKNKTVEILPIFYLFCLY
jgi:hypothetical protein